MRLPLRALRPGAAELPLDRGEVLRYLGYRPGVTRLEGRHEALVDRGIALALEASAPAVSLGYCGIILSGDEVMTRIPGLHWRSRSLARLLKGGLGVTLVAATLGPGVEELVSRLFGAEEFALATVVDAAGSALVHGLSRHVREHLEGQAEGVSLTPLYGPGYGDWEIHDQVALTVAAGGPAIGLVSNEACYLEPQKSVVGVIGWIAGEARHASGCQLCTMPDCSYRVLPAPVTVPVQKFRGK